jgi:hypothetical protein
MKTDEYSIDWLSGYEPSEKDKATADLIHEQSNQARLDYMTVNEIRELEDMKPIEGGDEIKKPQPQVAPGQQPEDNPDTEAGQTGDQDMTHPTLIESLKQLADEVHGKTKTVEAAMLDGQKIIRLYVDQEIERAKRYVSLKMKRPISYLPPEVDRQYEDMYKEYMSNLEAILKDAASATE